MIISTVITVIALVIIVAYVLFGVKRGMIKSSIIAGCYIISAVLASLLAKPVSGLFNGLSDMIARLLESNIGKLSDITDVNPSLVQFIPKLFIALLTPLLFIILFFIFNIIISIVLRITMKPVIALDACNAKPLDQDVSDEECKSRKEKVTLSRLVGGVVGLVTGLVLMFVLFLPLAGYLNMTNETMSIIINATQRTVQTESNEQLLASSNSERSQLEEINYEYIKPTVNNVFIKAVYMVGGKASFYNMTSCKLDGKKASVAKEVAIISSLMNEVQKLTEKPLKNYTNDQTDALGKLTEKFNDSVILPKVAATVLSGASEKWSNDEKFLGFEKPTVPSIFVSLFNQSLQIFKTETEDTVKSDLDTLADIFTILIDNSVFSSVENQDELMQVLATEGFITSVLTTLCDNNRMVVLTNEVTNIGVRAIATTLNMPENKTVVHQTVVNNIKEKTHNIINLPTISTEEKVDILSKDLNIVFSDNGMDMSTVITPIIAESLLERFKDKQDEDITNEEINDYFVWLNAVYEAKSDIFIKANFDSKPAMVSLAAKPAIISLAASGVSEIDQSADTLTLTYDEFVVLYNSNKDKFQADRYKLKEGMTLQDLYDQIYTDLNAVLKAVKKIQESSPDTSHDSLLSLATPEKLITNLKTIDDLMIKTDEPVINSENAEEEGKKLEMIMRKASDVLTSVNNMNKAKEEGKNTLESLKDFNFNAMGEMLDLLGSTTAFGNSTDSIAESMLNHVTGQKTNLIDEMKQNDSNYTSLFNTVGNTTRVIIGATDDQLSDEEKFANIEQLMKDLTPGNANIISSIISPNLLKDQGVPAEYSDKTSTMIKTLFNEMSKVEEANVNKEANAVKYLFDLGMASKEDTSTPLFGQNGKIKDTDDFVNRCLTSEVVAKTLEDTVYDSSNNIILDPIGLKDKINNENQNEVIDALNRYIANNSITPANTKDVRDIAALASIFNIETVITTNTISFTAK